MVCSGGERSRSVTSVGSAILSDVKAIRAHVHNGTIVPDEPIDLPEGAAVEVLLPENGELAEIEAEIEASKAEFDRGEFEDAHAFALKLVAKS